MVEQAGAGVGFAPGDGFFGMTGGVGDVQGSLAEYAAVDARLLARKSSSPMREPSHHCSTPGASPSPKSPSPTAAVESGTARGKIVIDVG